MVGSFFASDPPFRRRAGHRVSRHESRQNLALAFGATDIVEDGGDEGVTRMKDLTGGYAVGTQELMTQAVRSTRPGHVAYGGVSHAVELPGEELFFSGVHLYGVPGPVRRCLPDLIPRICEHSIDPRKVFDLESRSNGQPRVVEPRTSGAPSW